MLQQSIADEKHKILSQIRIFDDFLPGYNFEELKVKHNFEKMNETMGDGSYIGVDKVYPKLGKDICEYASIELAKINYGIVKSVLTEVLIVSDISSKFRQSRHVDDTCRHPFGFTLSYHWLGENNSGGTSFFLNFEEEVPLLNVPFKQNRLVVFPAKIPHQGYANPNFAYNSKRVIYTLFSVLENFDY